MRQDADAIGGLAPIVIGKPEGLDAVSAAVSAPQQPAACAIVRPALPAKVRTANNDRAPVRLASRL
jgi:hypothetical protein